MEPYDEITKIIISEKFCFIHFEKKNCYYARNTPPHKKALLFR